jgi:hypothetical protein
MTQCRIDQVKNLKEIIEIIARGLNKKTAEKIRSLLEEASKTEK